MKRTLAPRYRGAVVAMAVMALTAATVGLLPACFSPTEPVLGSDLLFTGSWFWSGYSPAGNGDYLSTRAGSGLLAGEWKEYRLGALSASATVSGSYDTSGAFTVRLRYSTGRTATFVGNAFGADSLQGTWADSAAGLVARFIFYRSPPPPCADTVRVRGHYIPPLAPSYFVGFRNRVEPQTEAERLAGRYGFTLDQVSTSAPRGFSAQLTSAELMVVQCEPSVDSIAYVAGY